MNLAQKEYLKNHSENYTVPELAVSTGLTEIQVENFCQRNGLRYKYVEKSRKRNKRFIAIKTTARPPAVYSNHSPFKIAS